MAFALALVSTSGDAPVPAKEVQAMRIDGVLPGWKKKNTDHPTRLDDDQHLDRS